MGIIMTPKEKAKELFEKFYLCMPFKDVKLTSCDENPELIIDMEKLSAKQCALISVNEVLEIIRYHGTDIGKHSLLFWQQVKTEIEAL